jgi:hypothetical protein
MSGFLCLYTRTCVDPSVYTLGHVRSPLFIHSDMSGALCLYTRTCPKPSVYTLGHVRIPLFIHLDQSEALCLYTRTCPDPFVDTIGRVWSPLPPQCPLYRNKLWRRPADGLMAGFLPILPALHPGLWPAHNLLAPDSV